MSLFISSIAWSVLFGLIRIALGSPWDNKKQIWPVTFWTLSALVALRGSSTLTTVLWRLHLILGTNIGPDGLHFPGFTLGPELSATLIYGRMLFTIIPYCGWPGTVAFAAMVFYLRHFMYPYNEYFDLSWAFAWWLLNIACTFAMAPGMPLGWYGMWYGIMSTTAFLIRPDQSQMRFISWVAVIIVLRAIIFVLYATWLAKDIFYPAFFSSSSLVQTWRVSNSVWYPLSSRDPMLRDYAALCGRCDQITKKSALIMGSSLYVTRLVEWHTYWSRKELCFAFGQDMPIHQPNIIRSESDAKNCRLCSLIWHSMSLKRRENIIASTIIGAGAVDITSSQLSIPTNVNDELRAIEWIRLCRENHILCNSKSGRNQELPARLLYVSAGMNWKPGDRPAIIKLVRTIDLDKRPEYVAFSHCWGPSGTMRFKLLASNIDQCYEGINFTWLSQNMQDAITTTLSLGAFSYIWIDSLCIIQKDEREPSGDGIWKRDWEVEAKKMGGVYSGAALTIASTGSSSSDGGCFHARNTQSLRPVKIGVSSRTSLDADWIFARQDDIFDVERNVSLAPLNTRGWVMQERLLSRRILHFGAEMIYWECCGRSASEFNPHGYTYKSYPEDFSDWYAPDLGNMETREDLQRGERKGRGFSWASSESVRRRPPPVMIDPDNETATLGTQAGLWQRRRGFWKDVLKRADEPWSQDEKNNEQIRRDRAGFRATFETLRHSFSQMWYDIVESYSRSKLTMSTDKLVALKGIEDEIAYATGFTYMYGLWRESLVADMLWFAIEGPGRRLRTDLGAPVAPTWSWASIDAPVALDLLPENSRATIELKQQLVSVLDVRDSGDAYTPMNAFKIGGACIELRGWMFPISRHSPGADIDADVWTIGIYEAKPILARIFFDIDSQDIFVESSFMCMPFLILERDKPDLFTGSRSQDIQGLVLRLVRMSDGRNSPDVYERVGYFTTSHTPTSRNVSGLQAAFKSHEEETICLAG
ncbi:heterokaryon incompatibility protein-domain-containing protein [Xylaria sp. FL1777]|nr:heterokaryon incompatibility protein-domain-containing protein [Xylaria sp. FL1777]